jgi:lipopolysaccharide biosynthesis protein
VVENVNTERKLNHITIEPILSVFFQIMNGGESANIKYLQEENLRLHMMIASFESSRSWRMTAPLRNTVAFLRTHHVLPEISQKISRGLLRTYTWHENVDFDEPGHPRIAVIAHIYYPDLADEIAAAIEKCGPGTTVTVTYVDPNALPEIRDAFLNRQITNIEYLLVENLGRDMWPFIQALKSESLNDVDAILKIHTKRSLHLERGKGDAWRTSLINGLVPNESAIAHLAAEFAQNPRLAWACPAEWVAGNESWGRNKQTVKRLLNDLNLKRPRTLVFPAGSMFWMGRELRRGLLDLELSRNDFSSIPALDGSFEHGLERFVGSWSLATQLIMFRTEHLPITRRRTEYPENIRGDQLDSQES